jgi:hypothetical protein
LKVFRLLFPLWLYINDVFLMIFLLNPICLPKKLVSLG